VGGVNIHNVIEWYSWYYSISCGFSLDVPKLHKDLIFKKLNKLAVRRLINRKDVEGKCAFM